MIGANKRRNSFSRSKSTILLSGVVMVSLALAVLINPIAAVVTLVRIIGWVLVVYGAITLASAFMRGDPVRNAPADLAIGAFTAVPGLIMALFPNTFVSFVWTFIGVIVLLTGVLDIFEAGDLRRFGSALALPATASGVITAVLGLMVVIAPFFSLEVGMLLAAAALLVDGVTEIVFGLGM